MKENLLMAIKKMALHNYMCMKIILMKAIFQNNNHNIKLSISIYLEVVI